MIILINLHENCCALNIYVIVIVFMCVHCAMFASNQLAKREKKNHTYFSITKWSITTYYVVRANLFHPRKYPDRSSLSSSLSLHMQLSSQQTNGAIASFSIWTMMIMIVSIEIITISITNWLFFFLFFTNEKKNTRTEEQKKDKSNCYARCSASNTIKACMRTRKWIQQLSLLLFSSFIRHNYSHEKRNWFYFTRFVFLSRTCWSVFIFIVYMVQFENV